MTTWKSRSIRTRDHQVTMNLIIVQTRRDRIEAINVAEVDQEVKTIHLIDHHHCHLNAKRKKTSSVSFRLNLTACSTKELKNRVVRKTLDLKYLRKLARSS